MKIGVSALERAFELAKSGSCKSVQEVCKILNREGYSADQVCGPMLSRQMNEFIKAATPGEGQ